MIRRVLVVALWLAAGAAVLATLYWLFLITPESNVLMLIASALLTLTTIATMAIVANGAVLLAIGGTVRASFAAGARRAGWFVVAAAPLVFLVWLVNTADVWMTQHSGEISAWFIARFEWPEVTPLFVAQRYVSVWLRWVLFPVAAIAGLASLLARDSSTRRQWLTAAWHWRTLLVATLAFVVLVALPWRVAFWQTDGLPHNWIEPTVAALRLAAVATLIVVGYAIIIVTAARRIGQGSHHVES